MVTRPCFVVTISGVPKKQADEAQKAIHPRLLVLHKRFPNLQFEVRRFPDRKTMEETVEFEKHHDIQTYDAKTGNVTCTCGEKTAKYPKHYTDAYLGFRKEAKTKP